MVLNLGIPRQVYVEHLDGLLRKPNLYKTQLFNLQSLLTKDIHQVLLEFNTQFAEFEARLKKDQAKAVQMDRSENSEHSAYISQLHNEIELIHVNLKAQIAQVHSS